MTARYKADQARPKRATIGARMAAAGAVLVGVIALTGFWLAGPAGAQEPSVISVLVVDDNGPLAGIQVDLFASDESGQRLGWIESQTTERGSLELLVEPGCYVTTAIASPGRVFTDGSQWSNQASCVQSGGFATVMTRLEGTNNRGRVSGNVRQGANGVAGISIGAFDVTADGSRGPWLRDVSTKEFGDYNILLAPGCYVLTAVAPGDDVFENGTPWDNQPVCVADGEERWIDFVLTPTSTSRIQVLVVEPNFESVSGVQIDLFTSEAESTNRLDWVESTSTDSDGVAGFDVLGGCWVMTAIAPEGRTFANSGTQWSDYHDCRPGGGFVFDPVFIQLAEE